MGRISLSALGSPPVSFLIWDQAPNLLHDVDDKEDEDDHALTASTSFFLPDDQAPSCSTTHPCLAFELLGGRLTYHGQ